MNQWQYGPGNLYPPWDETLLCIRPSPLPLCLMSVSVFISHSYPYLHNLPSTNHILDPIVRNVPDSIENDAIWTGAQRWIIFGNSKRGGRWHDLSHGLHSRRHCGKTLWIYLTFVACNILYLSGSLRSFKGIVHNFFIFGQNSYFE